MLHPVTALSIATAVGSGFFLYAQKHHTALLDRDIARVIQETQTARERTGLLRSEWALLNDPDRLQELAGHYLSLTPLVPSQFVQLADLHAHLPDPVTNPPAGDDGADAAVKDAPANNMASVSPPPPAPMPVSLAPASAAPKQAALTQPKARPPRRMALARTEALHDPGLASTMPAVAHPMRHAAPAALVAARPSYVIASPYGTQYRAAYAAPVAPPSPRSTIAANSVPAVASALGGRPSLPPPVPLGAYP